MAELKDVNKNSSSSKPQQIEIYPGNNDFLEFEDAFLDLLKAYSLCLINLKLFKFNDELILFDVFSFGKMPTANILKGNILAPRILRWRLARHVQLVRECFLMLVAQNRGKVAPDILCRFEQYCADMEKISSQVERYGLIALFYGAIPGLILGIIGSKISDMTSANVIFLNVSLLFIIIIYIVMFLFLGIYGSNRLFADAEIQDKEDKLFILIGKKLDFKIKRLRPISGSERIKFVFESMETKAYWKWVAKISFLCILIMGLILLFLRAFERR